jgi:hypothetical protein
MELWQLGKAAANMEFVVGFDLLFDKAPKLRCVIVSKIL